MCTTACRWDALRQWWWCGNRAHSPMTLEYAASRRIALFSSASQRWDIFTDAWRRIGEWLASEDRRGGTP